MGGNGVVEEEGAGVSGDEVAGWRIDEMRLASNSWGSRLYGGGCMNENQFMGLG